MLQLFVSALGRFASRKKITRITQTICFSNRLTFLAAVIFVVYIQMVDLEKKGTQTEGSHRIKRTNGQKLKTTKDI